MTAIAAAFGPKYGFIATDSRGETHDGCCIDLKISESACGRFALACIGATGIRERYQAEWKSANTVVLNCLGEFGYASPLSISKGIIKHAACLTESEAKREAYCVAVIVDKLEREIIVATLEGEGDAPPAYVELRSPHGLSVYGSFKNTQIVENQFSGDAEAQRFCEAKIARACAEYPQYFEAPMQMVRLRLPCASCSIN